MNEVISKENKKIENMIYEVSGKQVMLDSDLAKLYQCKNGTKEINQAVKNNMEKFPERFFWKLTDEESNFLLVKIFDQKNDSDTRGGRFKNPRVFTEQGVAMLATILKTKVAVQVSINIMDTFVAMRKYISNKQVENILIKDKLLEHDKRISIIEDAFSKFKENSNEVYFNGQIYDAYSKLIDIMSKAKEEIIIIDSYADKSVLDMISKINCKVVLICKRKTLLKNIDIDKYNKQYSNLKIVYNDEFHDRYIILDRNIIYHCGTSLNYAGSKIFSINKLEDLVVINNLIENIVNKI